MKSFLSHLECGRSGNVYDAFSLQNLSAVGAPLLARYDLAAAAHALKKRDLVGRRVDMWRYFEVLPVGDYSRLVSLGEGFTPLSRVDRLGGELGLRCLFVKDESANPTGSFKARGLAAAVNAARERGAVRLAIPSAGNAAGAMAAYAAASGLEAYVFMPLDTPAAFIAECRSYGAHLELVDGLIHDCGHIVGDRKEEEGWFDVSTLKEPYRIEGKKTMGFELAEQFDWELPDVILYPTGGGTGLVGMWKAFAEMEEMGWIGSKRPRMVSVQATGCAPIVKAFEQGELRAQPWDGAQTVASGLRVPMALGDFLILKALRESGGIAIAVTDEELTEASHLMARLTGIFPAPEGGATLAALQQLSWRGWLEADERIVLFNTGMGYKYLEVLAGDIQGQGFDPS